MTGQLLLTNQGLEKLKNELEGLKERRKIVVERIKTAREYGDLSENSEYEDAKNEQSFVEGRIIEVEEMIKRAKVVAKNGTGNVEMGSTVTLKMDGEKLEYMIVSSSESDPATGKISSESPIGYSLMGKAKGDKVEINTPNGKMECTIVEIS